VGDHGLDAVARQHLQYGDERRLGQRMRVHAEKQRAVDSLLLPVQADRLLHGQDVRLVE
jgi:hypothetical protein